MMKEKHIILVLVMVSTVSLYINFDTRFESQKFWPIEKNNYISHDNNNNNNYYFSQNSAFIKQFNQILKFKTEYYSYLSSIVLTKTDDISDGNLQSTPTDKNQLNTLIDMNNVLDLELESLATHMNAWRESVLSNISQQIQDRIHYLQNRAKDSCKTVRKVFCRYGSDGFAAQMQNLILCVMQAFTTDSMAIVRQLLPNYFRHSSLTWDHYIQPLSETCQPNAGISYNEDKRWRFKNNKTHNKLAKVIDELHSEPKLFWWSQFAKYVMRPNGYVNHVLQQTMKRCDFGHPIVGVHIRRGDKIGREAVNHVNQEYMFHVQNFYDKLWLKGYNGVKRVFIASDDSSVFAHLPQQYPQFKFIDKSCFDVNETYETRKEDPSDYANIIYIMIDIHLLSRTDYLVCTMSSTVCRLAYEMMTAFTNTFIPRYQSLDSPWFRTYSDSHMSRTFKYSHSMVKSDNINTIYNFSALSMVRLEDDWNKLAKRGDRRNGFVSCIRDNNYTNKFQCPLYKTNESISLADLVN